MNSRSTQVSFTAIGLILSSAACFTAIDTIVKYLVVRYSVPLVVWARWAAPALFMLAFAGPRTFRALLRTANSKIHVVRGAVLTLSSLCFFGALKSLPLAEATGLNYLTPILVTLMASWVLRERISRARWAFVAAGFVGMLLILRPGSGMLHVASLFVLVAATLNATFQILTRRLAGEDLTVLILYPSLVGAGLMSLGAPFFNYDFAFRTSDIFVFLAVAIVGCLGHWLLVQAFQQAPASMIAPFTYAQLVWSTLAAWVAFGTFPDLWALMGMVVIVASAVVLIWYETWRSRLSPFDPTTEHWLQSPIMMSLPGVGVTEKQLGADPTGLSAGVLQLRVGESGEVPSATGSPKTVIRTN